jgi:drug/metabolite transporter (DMT)-like permease
MLAAMAIVMTEVAMRFYGLTPLLVALYSSLIGGFLLMAPLARQGMGFFRCWPRGDWVRFVAASLLLFVVGMVLVFLSIDLIGASKSSMISRLESLFVVGLAVLVLGEQWTRRRWVASVVTLAGTILVNFDPEALELMLGAGELVNVAAAFAFASGIIILKPMLARHDTQLLTGSAMLFGALILLPICFYLDAWSGAAEITDTETYGPVWLSVTLLMVMSLLRALSWSVYIIAMRHIGAARCSIFFLTSVIFIVVLQVSLDAIAPGLGLQVPPYLLPVLGGGSLIVLGIFMLQRS